MKTKLKIRTQYNRSEFKTNYEVNKDKSRTVPDQTMTIAEIVKRYNHGMPVSGKGDPQFNEELLPNLAKMDLSEIHDLQKKVAQDIEDIRKRVQKARTDKYNKELEEMYRKKFASEQKPEDASQGSQAGLPVNNPSGTL